MLSSYVLVALAAACSLVSAASNDSAICSTSLYASLGCLTSHANAASLCAKAPRQTVTLTVTTTTLDVNSVTMTKHAQSQVTVQSTSTQLSVKTVTSGRYKTTTSTFTDLSTENTTLTTYVPTKTAGLFPPLCIPSNAIAALGSLGNGTLATACSCIGHRLSTTTLTSTITAKPVQTTSTAIDGVSPTTTIYHIVLHTTTLTVRPVKTVTTSVSSCTTSTTVETYAAPTFTQVYGPKAGCADTAKGLPKKLDVSVTNLGTATEACKNLCEQDAKCEFVYVQRLFAQSDGKPYFACTLNGHHLDAEKDLDCERKAGVYGMAVGFDAYERGTEPIVF